MWTVAAEVDLFRWHWSLDFDDMAALLAAATALLGVVLVRRSLVKQRSINETVDAPVLAKFLELTNEVATLRTELAEARQEIREMRVELTNQGKVEEYLRGVIHARDKEIETLRFRVKHLEDVCRRAGINGEED